VPQRQTDVVVIGAGIIGCAVAFELAAAGASVHVVDARTPGAGASHASAGVLAPYLEGHGSPDLRRLGRRSLDLYPGFVDRVVKASGRDVEYERLGTMEVAFTEDEAATLQRRAVALAADGIEAYWIAPPVLADLEPHLAPHALGGLHIPGHAAVHVPALTAALAQAAQRRGAVFSSGVAVSRLSAAGDGVAVHLGERILEARQVVLAAGTWVSGLVPPGSDPLPVRPIRGQLLHLAAPPRTLRHVAWGTRVYLVPWRDGTVFVGATSEDVGFDERNTAAGVASLLDGAIELVPALSGAAFVEARRGLRPASADGLPYVGQSAMLPGLIYACGHYRNGALLAPLTAELVARVTAGDDGDDALHTLAPSRAGRL
jgi:glycine oxidase